MVQAGIALIASCLPIIHSLEPLSSLRSLIKRMRKSTYESLHNSNRPWNRGKSTRDGEAQASLTRLAAQENPFRSESSRNASIPSANIEMQRKGPPTPLVKDPVYLAPRVDVPLRGEHDWRFTLPSRLEEGRTEIPVPTRITPTRSQNQGRGGRESWI